ncbi:MAG TPA: Ig-like domain-containing protein, partial [Dehalococcoidia bacterium]|nr:Ig-like domain-containing protein [Dehalococcoidia bacterium]
SRDIMDMLIWRNKAGGIVWGAYNQKNKYYGAQVLQNGGMALEVTSTNSFLQDSVVAGNGAADNIGFRINAYIVPQTPNTPVWLVRNIFKDLKTAGIVLNHNPCGDASLEERPIIATGCGALYMTSMGNIYQNVGVPLDFGWQANANSSIKVFDWTGPSVGSPDFMVLRKDQQDASKQGPISEKLVTSQTSYSTVLDALVTPMTSLPSTISYVGLEPARPDREDPVDYTFTAAQDYPPQVSMQVTLNGTQATLKASPTDDKAVTRVEFFVDWIKVGTRTAAPYEVTVDLANLPADGTSLGERRYAYLYARAFDGTQQIKGYEQRAYSQVVEVGPEFIVGAQPQPVPGDTNKAPITNAGPDQTVTLPGAVSLDGTVADDGQPSGVITSLWSKVSGPGTVTFANPAVVDTTATFSVAGAYVLRLTASDGASTSGGAGIASDGSLTASDDVAVTATAADQPQPSTLRVVGLRVVGTPTPGESATIYVRVLDASDNAVSGATVNLSMDTGDADQQPNYQWTKTTGTGGRVTVRFKSAPGDLLPWTITAVASKDGAQGSRTIVVQ